MLKVQIEVVKEVYERMSDVQKDQLCLEVRKRVAQHLFHLSIEVKNVGAAIIVPAYSQNCPNVCASVIFSAGDSFRPSSTVLSAMSRDIKEWLETTPVLDGLDIRAVAAWPCPQEGAKFAKGQRKEG